MEFCPQCDNMLSVVRKGKNKEKKDRKKYWKCSSCGYERAYDDITDKGKAIIKETINRTNKDKTAIVLTSTTNGRNVGEDFRESEEWRFEQNE